MPIRPENKELYPENWDEISLRIREEAGQKCEWCKKPNSQIVCCAAGGFWWDDEAEAWRDKQGKIFPGTPPAGGWRRVRVILTVAHLNHDPSDCRRENLRALCQSCHLTYDAAHHAETRRKNKYKNQTELPFDGDKQR